MTQERKRDQSSRPVARFLQRILPLLPFIVLPLILLWRPLFAGEALFWGTPVLQFVPWQRLASEMWRSGHLPLWNHLLGCGAPLAANYQTGAFYPLYGLALFLPAETALGWSVALHMMLTGLGMYAWARAIGLDRFPALIAGLTLEGSGFLVARVGLFPSIAVTFSWIPIWLWRAERLVRTGRLRDGLWLGGVLGLGFLAGHAQTAVYGGLLLAAYVLYRLISRSSLRISRLCLFGLALLLGIGLAAVQLLPTAELLHASQRATGVEEEVGLTYSLWPWHLITLVAPDFFGDPAQGTYWGYGNYWEDAVYVGLLPLLLAGLAVAGLRRKRATRSATIFWLSVGIGSLFLALGRNNPVFLWMYTHIPGFDAFQAPARWLAVTVVALAALAGIGAQQWRRGRADRRRGGLGIAIGLAMMLAGAVGPHLVPSIPSTFGPATLRLGLTLTAVGVLVLMRKDAGWWRGAMVGLILFDLLAFGWGLAPSVDRALYAGRSATGASLAANPFVGRIFWPFEGRPEPGYDLKFERFFRFDTFGPHDLDFWWSLRETLLPNLGMLEGIPSANNFDPLLVGRYADVARAAGTSPALLRAMGVTHLVTATLDAEAHVTPLLNPSARAWIVPTARQVPEEETWNVLTDPTFDPTTTVLLNAPPHPLEQESPSSPLVTLHDAPNRVTIHATLDHSGYLVLADTWYPGWHAFIDGQPAPLLRANYAFRAVYLERGEHIVDMVYRPLSILIGGGLTLASLLGGAIGLMITRKEGTRA